MCKISKTINFELNNGLMIEVDFIFKIKLFSVVDFKTKSKFLTYAYCDCEVYGSC